MNSKNITYTFVIEHENIDGTISRKENKMSGLILHQVFTPMDIIAETLGALYVAMEKEIDKPRPSAGVEKKG